MGLSIYLSHMHKVDHSRTYTEDEFSKEFPKVVRHILGTCKEIPDPMKVFEGLSPDYVAKVVCGFYDEDKLLASKGKDKKDGWVCVGEGYDEICKEEWPENKDDLLNCLMFSRCDKDRKVNEFVWVVITRQNIDEFTRFEECWCICDMDDEIGYMRKGANEKFYVDGMWEDPKKIRVFSKKILKEHMEKYFDESGDERYGNARAFFKENIYDKFKEDEGMFVIYG